MYVIYSIEPIGSILYLYTYIYILSLYLFTYLYYVDIYIKKKYK